MELIWCFIAVLGSEQRGKGGPGAWLRTASLHRVGVRPGSLLPCPTLPAAVDGHYALWRWLKPTPAGRPMTQRRSRTEQEGS